MQILWPVKNNAFHQTQCTIQHLPKVNICSWNGEASLLQELLKAGQIWPEDNY